MLKIQFNIIFKIFILIINYSKNFLLVSIIYIKIAKTY